MHLEMRALRTLDRSKLDQKTYSRRRFLSLAAAGILSMGIRDKEPSAFRQIGNIAADIFSHNADTLSKIENSTGIPAIEMDVIQMPDGTLAVGHSI